MTPDEIPPGALPPRPVMLGRYLIRSRKSALLIGLIDSLLVPIPKHRPQLPRTYARILVANLGHLGDVVLTLPAIAVLRGRYPEARIGMIVGSWSKAVAQGSGLLDDIHVVDHWIVNRTGAPRRARHRETAAKALAEIKSAGYEIGIDFYPFFPPAHPLFWRAGIPVRVGFTSGGFGPLLTHAVRWCDSDRPIADYARDLLDAVLPRPVAVGELEWSYPIPAAAPPAPLEEGCYIVVHPGAGAAFKDWSEENWHALVASLRTRGETVALTGAGVREREIAKRLNGEGVIDLVGKLDWNGFVATIARARALVCPDTVAGHVGALFRVPTAAIFTGTNNPVQWGPNSPVARVLVKQVACAPCNRPGCPAMACIRGVTPAQVLVVLDALLVRQA